MGLLLQNPHTFTIANWDGREAEDVRFVQYSGNVSGIFILSSKNLLVHFTWQEGGAAGVTRKWNFRFSGKSPIQILYLGSSAFLQPNVEHLMVVKEQQGIVLYRVDPSGAEQLVADARFHNIQGRSVTQAKFLVGNIFQDANLNPGLVYQPPEGEVSIFAANYRSWEDPEEEPFTEGELALPEGLSGEKRVWIIQGGEGIQDFIVAAPILNGAYDGNSTLELYGINAAFELELWSQARLPAQVQPQSLDLALGDSSGVPNQLVVYFDGSLGVVYNSSLGSNEFIPNAYFYNHDGASTPSKALRSSGLGSSIIQNGPKILQKNNDNATMFLKDESYWSGQYLKPLAFSQTKNMLLYEQNQTLHVSHFHINPSPTLVESRPNFVEEADTFWSSAPLPQQIQVNEDATHWSSYELPLQEQIRLEQFLEPAVNLPSGQLSLALSLIPSVNFQLQYSPSSGTGPGDTNQAVGRNWQLHGASYVALDMRQSHFLHNRSYYIVYNGQAFSLKASAAQEEGGPLRFQTADETEDDDFQLLDVTFYPDNNTWKAGTSSTQLRFGGDLEGNSVKKGAISMNWALDGEAQTRSLALEWHLTEEENLLTRKKLSYEYVQQMEVRQGIEVTKQVHMKRVKGQDMDAIFEIDSSTQFQLKGYHFRSSKYSQRVQFGYNYVGGDSFLSEVSQCLQTSPTCLPVLQFSYSLTLPSQLVRVTIPPWRTLVTYTYQNPPEPPEPVGTTTVSPSSASFSAFSSVHGQGFSGLTTEDSFHIYKITDGNLTSFRIEERLDANHRLGMAGRCMFLLNKNKLQTFCASRGNGDNGEFTWEAKRGLSLNLYSEEVLMTRKGAVMVQTGPRSLALYQYDVSQDSWITTGYFTEGRIKYMRMDDTLEVLAWIDDLNQVYWITHPTGEGSDRLSWSPVKTKDLSSRTSCSTLFSRIFSLGAKLEQTIQEFFANFDFQLKENIIALYSCNISGSTFESVVDLLILDENAEAVSRQMPIAKSNLLDLGYEQEMEQDGKKYKLAYKYEMSGGKFLVRIDVTGQPKAVSDELTSNFRTDEEKKDTRACLLSFGNFEMFLLPSSVIYGGNNLKIAYDNRRGWVRGTRDSNENNPDYMRVPLQNSNDDLYLLKEGAKGSISIKSGSSGNLVYDFGSTNLTQLGLYYPNYIAAPSGSTNDLSIVRFEGGSRIKVSQLEGVENIPNLSGPQVLVTHNQASGIAANRDTQSGTQIPILLRSLFGDPQQVLSKLHVRSGTTLDRVVHYEYDRPSRLLTGNLLFHKSRVMPGKIPRYYGWIQRDATQTSNGTIWSTKTYDRYGNFLEDTKAEKQPEPDNEKMDARFILMDNSGKFKIANFHPFELSSCNTGYIGFEDYQRPQNHENCSQWEFPMTNIIRNGYGFTGRNFLRLSSSNDTLEMEIPWEQGQSYTVSAWTRTYTTEGATGGGSYIFAYLGDDSSPMYWISQRIYSWGRWNLNRLDIRGGDIEPYRALMYNASAPLEESSTLKIKFSISTDDNVALDVDDVIFAPETWDSEITVRDPETFLPTETFLGRSGLTTKRKYNPLGKPLVHINPKGQVLQIHLESTAINDHGLKRSVLFQATGAPGWYEYCEPVLDQGLRVQNTTQNWTVSPGKIHHSGPNQQNLNLDPGPQSSVLFHFSFSMKEDDSSFKLRFYGSTLTCTRNGGPASLEIEGVTCSSRVVGDDNDILMVMIEQSRFALWVGGDLVWEDLLDRSNPVELQDTLDMTLAGEVSIANMVIIPDPSIEVRYSNLQDQIVQNILLESADSVQVMQKFYDELGRSIGQTKKTIVRSSSGPLLSFRPRFAIPSTSSLEGSPMEVLGEVSQLNPGDGNYPFTQVRYDDRVMKKDWEAEGRPGERYRLGGQFETIYSSEPNPLVKILFPPEQDHRYRVVRTTQGYEETQVLRGKQDSERLVAKVGLLPNGEQLLSTYTYDLQGNLIAVSAPNYHQRNRTFLKGTPLSQDETSDAPFKNTYKFDSRSRVVEKRTTDGGISNLVYDRKDNIIYAIHRANIDPAVIHSIIYFDYEHQGEGALVEVGVLRNFTTTASPSRVLEGPFVKVPRKIIQRRVMQEENAFFRSDVILSLYEGGSGNYTETVGYDTVLNKPVFSGEVFRDVRNDTDTSELLRVARFEYNSKGDRVLKVELPFKSFSIRRKYTPSGNLRGVDFLDEESSLRLNVVEYTYDGENNVISEKLSDFGGASRLVTNFSYNSPGYPTKQSNSLIEEEMNYEDSGYGGYSLGRPNAPMWNKSSQKWTNPSSRISTRGFEKAGLSGTFSQTCFQALLHSGYINANGRILQLFHPGLAPSPMPPKCLVGSDAGILLKVFHSSFVQQKSFGFKYQYGTHRDLIKSKFLDFAGPKECSEPLTKGSFSRHLNPHLRNATDALWDSLVAEGFLHIDRQVGISSSLQGCRGSSLINPAVVSGIQSLPIETKFYAQNLVHHFAQNPSTAISASDLGNLLQGWGSPSATSDADTVLEFLSKNAYISSTSQKPTALILHPKLVEITAEALAEAELQSFEVFQTLRAYFNCAISSSPFDLQVLDQDANGNFKLFYNGQERVELQYEPGTNKVSRIIKSSWGRSEEFHVGHDSFGNLNVALHKGISLITYDEVFARPLSFHLLDGREIKLRYNHKGERVSKEVWSPGGRLLYSKNYTSRDEKGRCLLEEEVTFVSDSVPPQVRFTVYIYGARGLVGFWRDGKVYNVYTDNVGSVRFVLLNGEVVASYDYLPYGELISSYLQHPGVDIPYRFTGQEWDRETDLYNFQARIYDPFLGRFYQLDPEEQFFSPYKYGGSSPLNVVDPDGKLFSIILATVAFIAGAYLGGAAANNNWNPAQWDYTKASTWTGVVFGGLAGALIPVTGGLSAKYIGAALAAKGIAGGIGATLAAKAIVGGVGVVAAYLSTAAMYKNYNPAKWHWKSPQTFNSLFGGYAMGSGAFAGVGSLRSGFTALSSTLGRTAYISGAVGAFGGFGYLAAAAGNENFDPREWEWKFTWIHLATGGLAGATGVAGLTNGMKFMGTQIKIFSPGFGNMAKGLLASAKSLNPSHLKGLNLQQLVALAKSVGSVAAVGGLTYVSLASASGDWANFNFNHVATTSALFNGLYSGWMGGSGPKTVKGKSQIAAPSGIKNRFKSIGRNARCKRATGGTCSYAVLRTEIDTHKMLFFGKMLMAKLLDTLEFNHPGWNLGACISIMSDRLYMLAGISGSGKKSVGGFLAATVYDINRMFMDAQVLRWDLVFARMDRLQFIPLDGNVPLRDTIPMSSRASIGLAPALRRVERNIESVHLARVEWEINSVVQTLLDKTDLVQLVQDFPVLSQFTHTNLKSTMMTEMLNIFPRDFFDRKEFSLKNLLLHAISNVAKKDGLRAKVLTQIHGLDTPGSLRAFHDALNHLKDQKKADYLVFTGWHRSNCAENKCFNALKPSSWPEGDKVQAFFTSQFESALPFHISDVKFVASFDTRDFTPKQACPNCAIAINSVKALSRQLEVPTNTREMSTYTETIRRHPELAPNFDHTSPVLHKYNTREKRAAIRNNNTIVFSKASSSASSLHQGALISVVKLVRGWFGALKGPAASTTIGPSLTPPTKTSLGELRAKGRKTKGPRHNSGFHWDNCLPYVWVNGEYNLQGITCHSREGMVQVFPKMLMETGSTHNNPLAGASSIRQDTFSDCQFMYGYFGGKAAFCEGRNSDFIYTPYTTLLPAERLNEQLLLLVLGVHLWDRWTFSAQKDFQEETLCQRPAELFFEEFYQRARGVRNTIAKLTVDQTDPYLSKWVVYLIEDLEEEIEIIKEKGCTAEKLLTFEEKVEDLEEELRMTLEDQKPNAEACCFIEATAGSLWWQKIASYFTV